MRTNVGHLVVSAIYCSAMSAAIACSSPGPAQNGGADASTGHDGAVHHDAPSGMIDAPVTTTDAATACAPPNILHGDGHHNAGLDCMGGCHNHGFSIAGTLLLADRVTPANNATVTITDANHGTQTLIVGNNGNFFSFLPVAYPISISASLCPSTQSMITHPTAGACNASGCHAAGGVQGAAHL